MCWFLLTATQISLDYTSVPALLSLPTSPPTPPGWPPGHRRVPPPPGWPPGHRRVPGWAPVSQTLPLAVCFRLAVCTRQCYFLFMHCLHRGWACGLLHVQLVLLWSVWRLVQAFREKTLGREMLIIKKNFFYWNIIAL